TSEPQGDTPPAAQAAGTGTADGSASVQKISPPPAATRETHCRPHRPPASLSLFAEQEEKKCSETGLTPPRLHSRQSSPAGRARCTFTSGVAVLARPVRCNGWFGFPYVP